MGQSENLINNKDKTILDQNIPSMFKYINSLIHLKKFHHSSSENVREPVLFWKLENKG